MVAEQKYWFDVKMTCKGCSGAVTRVLEKAKAEGVSSYDVDLDKQEVVVNGTIPFERVKEIISKTGKEVRASKTLE